MYEEEDDSVFHLPVELTTVAPAVVAEAPVSAAPENVVAAAAKVVPAEAPAKIVNNSSNSGDLNDQDLFNELNAVSEEVIKCRNHILGNIY